MPEEKDKPNEAGSLAYVRDCIDLLAEFPVSCPADLDRRLF